MIEFVTVWYLVVCMNCYSNYADRYTIPYATQQICLKQAKKYKNAHCQFGQLPVYKQVK